MTTSAYINGDSVVTTLNTGVNGEKLIRKSFMRHLYHDLLKDTVISEEQKNTLDEMMMSSDEESNELAYSIITELHERNIQAKGSHLPKSAWSGSDQLGQCNEFRVKIQK